MTLTFEEKYQAILAKDASYEGLFITAVKTTGIFCRPVCPARKPKIENVEFFSSPAAALERGYRPCKVCRPMEHFGQTPDELRLLLESLDKNPENRIMDRDLKGLGLEPNMVRRWFKQNYGMTFQAYQRKLRLKLAHSQLDSGKSVTYTAFDSGYDSLSGFGDSFQKIFSVPPSSAPQKNILNIIRITTPLGVMIAGASREGICMLEFADRKQLKSYIEKLSSKLSAIALPGYNHHLEQLEEQVDDYFQGRSREFDLQLMPAGTDFQKQVWNSLQKIPYGSTSTYSQQAKMLGRPAAVRAVASANGQNPIAMVIPCHRVIGKDGNLTGYAGGLNRKRWLLEHEQRLTGQRITYH